MSSHTKTIRKRTGSNQIYRPALRKALEPDANAFFERAKSFELLPVPSDSFGCPGWVRVGYCVSHETIVNSMPAWKKLAESYK